MENYLDTKNIESLDTKYLDSLDTKYLDIFSVLSRLIYLNIFYSLGIQRVPNELVFGG